MQQLKLNVLNYLNGFPWSKNTYFYHSCSPPAIICAAVLSKIRSFLDGLTHWVDRIRLMSVYSTCLAFVASVLIFSYSPGIYPRSSSLEIYRGILEMHRSRTNFQNSQKFSQTAARTSCSCTRNSRDLFCCSVASQSLKDGGVSTNMAEIK